MYMQFPMSMYDWSVQKMNLHYFSLVASSTMTVSAYWSVAEVAHMLVLLVQYEMWLLLVTIILLLQLSSWIMSAAELWCAIVVSY